MVKHNKVFCILAVVVILSLLLVAIPATPALAQTLTLSPTSGPPGTTVTVTGTATGYTGGTVTVYIFLGSTLAGSGTITAITGYISGSFTVPTTAATGIASITAQTDSTYGMGTLLASGTFTVATRSITISSTSGYVGDTITVTGSGFTPSSTVTIYFDSTNLGTTTASATGVFTGFTFTVPDSTKGSHTIKAQDTSLSSITATFTVSPKITVTPTTGAVGDTVTVSGSGFTTSSSITVYFDATSMSTTITNTYGTFSAVTFTAPSVSRGSHTVKAQDASSNYATATFTVAQKIIINPTSGYSGITVTVTGSGFNASSAITIYYDGDIVGTDSTDATGNFSASFKVPGGLAGTYTVEANDGTNAATASFVSTTDATIDETTSTEDPGYVGMELTITGTGFMPNTEVEIIYESEAVTLATVETDGSGNFEAEITIPPSEGGHHTITVTDGTAIKEFDFYMESTPPDIPQPQLPLMGDKAKSEAYFDWDPVEDDSEPVTYDLQIATDDDFTEDSLLLDKTGLTASEYTLTKEEKLESTSKEEPYYWRVRAVDAASNEGDWTGAGEFYVGFVFGMPEITGWVLYVLIGVGALVVFFIGFWIGRRSGGGEYY